MGMVEWYQRDWREVPLSLVSWRDSNQSGDWPSGLPPLDPGEAYLTDDSGAYLTDETGAYLTGTEDE